jgi:hypothetical protein
MIKSPVSISHCLVPPYTTYFITGDKYILLTPHNSTYIHRFTNMHFTDFITWMVHLLEDWGANNLEYLMWKNSEEMINNKKKGYSIDLFRCF